MALASAVEFARLCGAVVVYVPSCLELLDGGMYHRNEEAGGWDTPDHARRLLTNLLEAHGHRLDAVPSPGGEGSLKDVAEGGLSRNTNVRAPSLCGCPAPPLQLQKRADGTCCSCPP